MIKKQLGAYLLIFLGINELHGNPLSTTSRSPYKDPSGFVEAMQLSKVLRALSAPRRTSVDAITLLHLAVMHGYLELAAQLLQNCPCVDSQDNFGNTALHWAAMRGHSNIAALLLKRDAAVAAQNNDGDTPLHAAAGYLTPQFSPITIVLLEAGPQLNRPNEFGQTPTHRAAHSLSGPIRYNREFDTLDMLQDAEFAHELTPHGRENADGLPNN